MQQVFPPPSVYPGYFGSGSVFQSMAGHAPGNQFYTPGTMFGGAQMMMPNPPERPEDHAVDLVSGSSPPNRPPYKVSAAQQKEIMSQVEELLEKGLIQPSSSPLCSPMLLVQKKDGSWHMCINYRALNKNTIKNRFPIPRIDDILDKLERAAMFSRIDLKIGYHQIRIRSEDVHKTAFRTTFGLYEFLVMPFGLTNALATFNRMMDRIFCPHQQFVDTFFDDMIVYSKNEEEHRHHLAIVFKELRSHRLLINAKKSEFFLEEIHFLGHIVSKDGVEMDLAKGHNAYGNRWTEIAKLVPGRKEETRCSAAKLTHKEALIGVPKSQKFGCSETSKKPKVNKTETTDSFFMQEVKDVGNSMSPRDRRAELEEVMGWLTARTPTPECEERNRSTPLVGPFLMQKNLAPPQSKHEISLSNMGSEIKLHESTNRGETQAMVHPDVEDLVFLLVGNGAKTFWNTKRDQTFDIHCSFPGFNSSIPNNADAIAKVNGGEFYSREPQAL
ncbi:hypothetical protein L7F22_048640 [Adiantum nelumboides]|nr:hypothetical protein [Adiantum nelumboides]